MSCCVVSRTGCPISTAASWMDFWDEAHFISCTFFKKDELPFLPEEPTRDQLLKHNFFLLLDFALPCLCKISRFRYVKYICRNAFQLLSAFRLSGLKSAVESSGVRRALSCLPPFPTFDQPFAYTVKTVPFTETGDCLAMCRSVEGEIRINKLEENT